MHIRARCSVEQSAVSQSSGVAEDRFFEQHSRTPYRAPSDTGGSSKAPCSTEARNAALSAHGVPSRGLSSHLEHPGAPSRLAQSLRTPKWAKHGRCGVFVAKARQVRCFRASRPRPVERPRGQSTAGAVFASQQTPNAPERPREPARKF